MSSVTFIQKIKEFFTPNKQIKSLLLEIVTLQEDMRVSLGHVDSSQKEIAEALKDAKGSILSLKRSHSGRDNKHKSLKSRSYDEETPAR